MDKTTDKSVVYEYTNTVFIYTSAALQVVFCSTKYILYRCVN